MILEFQSYSQIVTMFIHIYSLSQKNYREIKKTNVSSTLSQALRLWEVVAQSDIHRELISTTTILTNPLQETNF